jgi:nucleotide-binding universal stress UspA family protein
MSESQQPPLKVLVAVAFDETAERALLQGLRLAESVERSELHVVHGVDITGAAANDAVRAADAGLEEAPKLLHEQLDKLWKDHTPRQVVAHFRPGPAAATALQVAVDVDADVLVVGTHRRAGLEKLLLGSVAEQILRKAHCPVLVAMPKHYEGDKATERPAAACAACLKKRAETKGQTYWCENHQRQYKSPHVYVPRDQGRTSVLVTQ